MSTNSTQVIKFLQCGGPEVLTLQESILKEPAENEVLICHHAIGVNYIDTYYRTGLYPTSLPSGLGTEGAGVVEAIGKNVFHLKTGDRVAYATSTLGSYSERRVLPANVVVKIPEDVTFEQAASVMLKGLTVHYLFKSIFPLAKGDQVLFHAAAGGVGLLACQWARHLGAQLIGTVSSSEKGKIAKINGAFETINYTSENVVERISTLTNGKKLPVVFDGVGKSTWDMSLDCLRPKGLMISFGNASGAVTGVNLSTLAQKGSLFVTRPVLSHYVETYEKLNAASQEVFELVKSGALKVEKPKRFALKDVRVAHQELEDRKRIGSMILIP